MKRNSQRTRKEKNQAQRDQCKHNGVGEIVALRPRTSTYGERRDPKRYSCGSDEVARNRGAPRSHSAPHKRQSANTFDNYSRHDARLGKGSNLHSSVFYGAEREQSRIRKHDGSK